jgi:molybdopterin synthase sulfur carrier subunit
VVITVLYFAGLRDLVQREQEQFEVAPGLCVKDVLTQLSKRHTRLHFDGVRCALNEEFVALDHPVAGGDTLALIPPVSGG